MGKGGQLLGKGERKGRGGEIFRSRKGLGYDIAGMNVRPVGLGEDENEN